MKKKSVRLLISSLFLVLILGLTVYYLIKNDFITNLESLSNLKPWKILVLVGLLLIQFSLDGFIIYRSFSENKTFKYINGIETTMLGNMGSNITPYKAGHFPFMIAYYAKKKLKPHEILASATKNQIIYSTTIVLFYLFITIFTAINGGKVNIGNNNVYIYYGALIGLIVNGCIAIGTFLAAFMPKFHKIVINLQFFFISKFKKELNKQEFFNEKYEKSIEYRKQTVEIIKKPYKVIPQMVSYILYLSLCNCAIYVSYILLTDKCFNISEYFNFFALTLVVYYIALIVPIPGGTGVSEATYLLVFANVIEEELIGSVLILWRSYVFFIPVLLEVILYLILYIKDRIKDSKEKEIAEL